MLKYIPLVELDAKYRISVSATCFVLEIKEANNWINKYYYADIGAVMRGYFRQILIEKAKLTKKDNSILDILADLDSKVTTIIKKMHDIVELYDKDPVQVACMEV